MFWLWFAAWIFFCATLGYIIGDTIANSYLNNRGV